MASRWMQPKLDKLKRDGAVTKAARRDLRVASLGELNKERDAKRALIALAASVCDVQVVRCPTGNVTDRDDVGVCGKRKARRETRVYAEKARPGMVRAADCQSYTYDLLVVA